MAVTSLLRSPRVDMWPFYGFLAPDGFLQLYIERKPFTQKPIKRPYIGPWTTQEGRNTHLRKVSSFLLKSFHF